MPDDNTPESEPESAFPPRSASYHPGQANPPPISGYGSPGPQPNWPPPPVGSYPPMAAPQYSPVNGTMILILGILGLTICGLCAPIAWVLGNQAMAALNQYGDPLGQRGMVNGGRICGIIGTVLIALALVFYVILFALGMAGALMHPSTR